MQITILITYFLLAYGICNIIIFANGPFHIFSKMHDFLKTKYPILEEMMSCFICLPTWCGFFLSAVNIILFASIPFTPMNSIILNKELWYIIIFFDGLLTSGGCWLLHTLQEMMERIGNDER